MNDEIGDLKTRTRKSSMASRCLGAMYPLTSHSPFNHLTEIDTTVSSTLREFQGFDALLGAGFCQVLIEHIDHLICARSKPHELDRNAMIYDELLELLLWMISKRITIWIVVRLRVVFSAMAWCVGHKEENALL